MTRGQGQGDEETAGTRRARALCRTARDRNAAKGASRVKVPRIVRRRVHELILARLPRACVASQKPISFMIPLAVKDLDTARLSLAALRKHARHPIGEVVIAGQDHDLIRAFCAENNARYVNENDVMRRFVGASKFRDDPTQLMGWIKQQLLKLTAFEFTSGDSVLVHDSDTLYVRDIAFFNGARQICYMSDEYTKKYYPFLREIIGPVERHPRSFVAHSILLQRDIMAALDAHVRQRSGKGLIAHILDRLVAGEESRLSEFEIYGNFIHNFTPDRFETRYWYNRKISFSPGDRLEEIEARWGRYNSVSNHTRPD